MKREAAATYEAEDLRELNRIYREEENEIFTLDADVRRQWRNNVTASYEWLYGMTICRDMEIACRPTRGLPPEKWPRVLRVLEIGYGDSHGIATLVNKYRVAPKYITGIELIPECDKIARERWPDANWYLHEGRHNELPDMLNHWADNGIVFDLVVARHVMERVPNPDEVLPAIARVLKKTHPRFGRAQGIYAQVTPPKNRTNPLISPGFPGGGIIPHMTDLDATWNPTAQEWEPGGWPDKFHAAGLEIYRANRHMRKSHPGKREVTIFALTRGRA